MRDSRKSAVSTVPRSYEVLVSGCFRREQVAQNQSQGPHSPSDAAQIAVQWAAALDQASEQGQSLFNGDIFRLGAIKIEEGHLKLDYGTTCYRDYAMSRHNCESRPWANNPDPIGTALISVTRDGYVPLGRRSDKAFVNPGRYFTFGGFFDLADRDETGKPDIFACAQREWQEETGLTLDQNELQLISIVYDLANPHPEVAFTATLEQSVNEIRRCQWTTELGTLEFVPKLEAAAFARMHAPDFTESLLGALEIFEANLGTDQI